MYITSYADSLGSAAIGLTYQQLCERPNESIGNILRFLSVREPVARDYRKFIEPRVAPLLPEVERDLPNIEHRNRKYMSRFGIKSRL
jgi:hypothetical protein